ncbi:hypothetical protein BS50DRAFT_571057 [Corynespora cassiicola Philippines]|uniref:Uncharacterized protein n=1 Tax=Corynespora cassiicola Philippines TaxID=1448308 RepID=A0A2T2NW89_CORCC|nr:hypothetical protein BS50DRAFT_571057 [Corynespora cassiicola Philippines]
MENPATATWNLEISSSDATKILQGFQPQSMDDKWKCETDQPDEEGNTVIYFARSWTGNVMFQVKAIIPASGSSTSGQPEGSKPRFKELTWDRRSDVHETSEEEAKSTTIALCRGLLRCELKESS